jgi:hypothetical protein
MSSTSKLETPQCRILPAFCSDSNPEIVFEDVAAAPVQQIEIEPVGAEPLEAALAGAHRLLVAGVAGKDFGDEEHLVAPPGNSFARHFLGDAIGIHFGGVDEGHAQIDAGLQRPDLVGALAFIFAHFPGPLP